LGILSFRELNFDWSESPEPIGIGKVKELKDLWTHLKLRNSDVLIEINFLCEVQSKFSVYFVECIQATEKVYYLLVVNVIRCICDVTMIRRILQGKIILNKPIMYWIVQR
jgi:hypothetical protein